MLRALLVVAGLGLIFWGGLYWLELRNAGRDPPQAVTVDDVLAGDPFRPEGGSGRERHVRLSGIEVDLERKIKASEAMSFVPVKGTDDKLYLEIYRTPDPPAGRFTAIGHQRRANLSLPKELLGPANKGKLYVVFYNNAGYQRAQRAEAQLYFAFGGVCFLLAGVLQGCSFLMVFWDKKRLSQAQEGAELAQGPCALCGEQAELIPIYISAEKRRLIAPKLARTTSGTTYADCCPACFIQLGKLWQVTAVGQFVCVPLIFLFVFGGVMLFVRQGGIAMLCMGGAASLFLLLQLWIYWRHRKAVGRERLAGLKQQIDLMIWNPLADKITSGRRYVK